MTLSFFHALCSEIATSDGHRSNLHPLNNYFGLETVLHRIQVTIKECGNSIDTYYKQKRLGKISVLPPWFYRTHEVQLSSTRLEIGKPGCQDISTISRTIEFNYRKLSLLTPLRTSTSSSRR